MKPTVLDLIRSFTQSTLSLVGHSLVKQDTSNLNSELEESVTKFFEQARTLEEGAPGEPAAPLLLFKADDEQRLVYGWASVLTEKGIPVIDRQGHVIEVEEMQAAIHDFMTNSRRSDGMHVIKGVGQVVESVLFTKQLQDLLGINLNREGWFICVKVDNDEAWDHVKKGTLRAFSIGGSALLEPMD